MDAFQLVQLSVSNTLTIPTHSTTYRTDIPLATELTHAQGDLMHKDGRIINVLVEANGGGTPASLTLDQILGGHDGTHLCLMLANSGDDLTILHNPTRISLPFQSNMTVTDHLQPIRFVNRGGVYAYTGY